MKFLSKTTVKLNKMRHILKPFAILYVIYLRKKYKRLTIKWEYNQSNQHLATLQLLQAKIHYFHSQFLPWGYYHPSCVTTSGDGYDEFLEWLFPPKDFDELEIVAWHNPEAVTYYHNKIYTLMGGISPKYDKEIKKQLIKWNDNY